ncbi:DUF1971 domain-containing protein, partial [Salmonella enterica subsp. enterica serovar Kentucky]|nr:DUF1971 domain-containing protein [Salmonella enterica subsp. enterica serovar Kentucky]
MPAQTAPPTTANLNAWLNTFYAAEVERHLDKGTRPGVYPRLSVMQGAVKYLGYADEHCSEPEEIMV